MVVSETDRDWISNPRHVGVPQELLTPRKKRVTQNVEKGSEEFQISKILLSVTKLKKNPE